MRSSSLEAEQALRRAPADDVQQKALGLRVAVGLGISVAVCHGIGRFGYALLLPAMRQDLQWTYVLASWMNTANALGYVAGAISSYLLLHRYSAARLFVIGLLITVASVAVTGLSSSFGWLVVIRSLSGVGAAWAFSCGGAIVAERFSARPAVRGQATGIYFGCAGIGMVAAGLIVPAMIESGGNAAWPGIWAVLGALCTVLSIWPLREARKSQAGPVSQAGGVVRLRGMEASLLAYFLFGGHTRATSFSYLLGRGPRRWRGN